MKRLLRIVLWMAGALVVLLVLLAGATQTQFFRDRLRTAALRALNSTLDAEVRMGGITGNLVAGFAVDSVVIAYHGGDVVRVDQIKLRYNLLEIPGRTISISRLTLVRPTIRLVRDRAGAWNITSMVRAREDTGRSGPMTWSVVLKQLEIRGGTLVLTDSAALTADPPPPPEERFLHDLTLRDLNLSAAAEIAPREKHLLLEHLSCMSAQPELSLQRLAGEFTVTPLSASVRDLIVITGRSNLRLTASLDGVDLLDSPSLASLRDAQAGLAVEAHDLSLNELGTFLPAVNFLNGPASLDLKASGDFGDLNVERLELQTGHSRLQMTGRLQHLDAPRGLTMSVAMSQSRVSMADVRALLPSFDLPELSALGLANLTLGFEGRPLDFRTTFVLETAAGTVRTDGALKIGGPQTLAYRADVQMQQVDLAGVLQEESLASRLNGSLHIEGQGVRLNGLAARLDLKLDGSEFRGLPLTIPSLALAAAEGRLTMSADATLGGMRSVLSAVLDEQDASRPSFSVEGRVAALNLAPLLHDNAYDSDLTLGLKVHGTGLTLSTLGGDFLLDLSSSRYREYRISEGTVHVRLDQSDPNQKELNLRSNVADLSLTGAFDLSTMAALLASDVRGMRRALSATFGIRDTAATAGPLGRPGHRPATASRTKLPVPPPLDAQYELVVKDLEPVSIVAGEKTFNGTGVLRGTIRGDAQALSVRGQMDVDDFFYGDVEGGALVEDGSLTFVVNNLTAEDPLRLLDMRLNVAATKAHVNRNQFDSLDLVLSYEHGYARYAAGTRFNRDLAARVEGQAWISRDTVAFGLDDLAWGYQGFSWRADSGAVFRILGDAFAVERLVMRRDTQVVALHGSVGPEGRLAAQLDAMHVNLEDLKYLLAGAELGARQEAFTGGAEVHVTASGTLQDPIYAAQLNASNIAFRGKPFGGLHGTFAYKEGVIESDVAGGPDLARGDAALRITGTLPVNLSPADTGRGTASGAAPEGIAAHGPAAADGGALERPMNLTVHSTGVQMSILDPLLPTFNDLSGSLRCDLVIGGTLQHPRYGGDLVITQCGFLFVPNNIRYTLEGSFTASGERLTVVDAAIRNVAADTRGGRDGLLHITGDLALRDLVPGDFDLNATGKLLVVKETTRQSSLAVYGDLFVEIGPGGLHFTGEIERSLLKGSLLVSNSTLIFPPTQATVSEESPTSVPVVLIDDTSRAVEQRQVTAAARYFGLIRGNGKKTHDDSRNEIPSRSFLDGVRYDLDIETAGGNTQIQMVFNPMTNEELVAAIEGRFSITEDGKTWFGDLTVSRAYYNFFKRFSAEGKIRYTGDFNNPELDIAGTYQGTRTLQDSVSQRRENIVVTIKITGSRMKPKIALSMTIDGEDYYTYHGTAKSNDMESDAIAFILAGSFPLTSAEKNQVAADVGASVGSSLVTGAASPLTGMLSDFLRNQVGFISSVELNYTGQGGNLGERADIRLSGTAWSGYWRYGGKILEDPLANANFSILYSFGTIFNNMALRNLMFELERRVENNIIGATNDFKRVNSARLFYRFSF